MKKLYSILDQAAMVFCPPFPAATDEEAVRLIEGAMTNPNTTVHKYPTEHSLYYVGQFNDASGELEYEDPTKVMSGIEILGRMKKRAKDQQELNMEQN